MTNKTQVNLKYLQKLVETIVFASRWVLPFFYLILFAALIIYAYFDVKEFIDYIGNIKRIDKNVAMLTFIELIDMTMIANLGKMIITGSYNSFVSKLHGYKNENISSGLLKVKMSTSLVGVTAIALLQRSVEIEHVSWDTLYKLGYIHGLFLVASIILETVDYLHEKNLLAEDRFEFEKEKQENQNNEKFIETLKHRGVLPVTYVYHPTEA
jgi:uncharacterized protein (TIGR00645 family)